MFHYIICKVYILVFLSSREVCCQGNCFPEIYFRSCTGLSVDHIYNLIVAIQRRVDWRMMKSWSDALIQIGKYINKQLNQLIDKLLGCGLVVQYSGFQVFSGLIMLHTLAALNQAVSD
jgi:hypothetical protein